MAGENLLGMSEPLGEIGPESVPPPRERFLDPNDPPMFRIARVLGLCVMGLALVAIPAVLIFFGLTEGTAEPPDQRSQESIEAFRPFLRSNDHSQKAPRE